MKSKSIVMAVLAVLACHATLNPQLFAASPSGTVFTYQGRLDDGASPANGSYDLRFTLCDAASGGGQVGPLVTTNAVPVSNGLFTVLLDFESGAFTGDARWLDIAVKTNGAVSYTPLTPRQALSSVPYALNTANAQLLNGQGWTAFAPVSGSTVYVTKSGDIMTGTLNLPANGLLAGGTQLVLSGGNVGIGTPNPAAKLDVAGAVAIGNTSDPTPPAGTISWTGTDFEGYTGTNWISLTGRGNVPTNTVAPYTNMVWIPPGTFVMGSPDTEVARDSNEGPQTTVTLTRGFYLGKYEVTQGEYQALMGTNPSYFAGDPNRPVETVSWNDALSYCLFLTQREQDAARIPASYQYRLPTEAEWEYACRAGTTTRFSHGDDTDGTGLDLYAWYSANSGSTTHPVGQKFHNPWVLDDMHGNVSEMCSDWYTNSLPGGSVTDPQGPGTGSARVFRGGSWASWAGNCRSARRDYYQTVNRRAYVGFRVVLAPRRP